MDLSTWGSCIACAAQGVGLQAFGYNDLQNRTETFAKLSKRAEEFADAGFSHVWMPPISAAVDAAGYLPTEWYTIVASESVRSLTTALSGRGVTPVCDMIFNHRSGTTQNSCNTEWTEFTKPSWNFSAVVSNDHKCEGAPPRLLQTAFCDGSCTCGSNDTGDNLCYAPDLDHRNDALRRSIVEYMSWLQREGYCHGWRLDNARGYWPRAAREYVLSQKDSFAVGEYFSNSTDDLHMWTKESGISAFDFTQRYALQNAIAARNFTMLGPSGGLGLASLDATRAASFLDNHDFTNPSLGQLLGMPDKVKPFGSDHSQLLGYVYILTHPAMPWVFLPHLDGHNRQAILALIRLRQKAEVSTSDTVDVFSAQENLYAACIRGDLRTKLCVKIGAIDWKPPADVIVGSGGIDQTVLSSGEDWSVWVSSHETHAVEVSLSNERTRAQADDYLNGVAVLFAVAMLVFAALSMVCKWIYDLFVEAVILGRMTKWSYDSVSSDAHAEPLLLDRAMIQDSIGDESRAQSFTSSRSSNSVSSWFLANESNVNFPCGSSQGSLSPPVGSRCLQFTTP